MREGDLLHHRPDGESEPGLGAPARARKDTRSGLTLKTTRLKLRRLVLPRGEAEITDGITSVETAVGGTESGRTFLSFSRASHITRARGLRCVKGLDDLMIWSADFPADDWTHISAVQIRERALGRIEKAGRGILLLHDMQPATVKAVLLLLEDLKQRGFKVVHVVPQQTSEPVVASPDTRP